MISLLSSLPQAAGLFAQASFSTNIVDFNAVQSVGRRTSMDLRDDLILIGSLVVMAGIIFYLTALFRKRKHRHHHHHDRPERVARTERASGPANGAAAPDGKVRRRKRRRDHRPRNPTRAETGGIPPRRADDELPSV